MPSGKNHFSLRGACLTIAATLAFVASSFPQSNAEFHRALSVSAAEVLTLDIGLSKADVEVLYGRDGELSIYGSAKASRGITLDDDFFAATLNIHQQGNHIVLRQGDLGDRGKETSLVYRIEVPYRTEVVSRVGQGKQTISGIMGPARATSEQGDIKASYISKHIEAQTERGNIDLQVVGERADVRSGAGNITCERIPQGVTAQNEDGDITLLVVGPSTAVVSKGTGRIEVGGARGSLLATAAEGDIHVKAFPHDAWKLTSTSGSIRLELPPRTRATLDATTASGEFQIDRDDIAAPLPGIRHISQEVNGGGQPIQLLTSTGRISLR